MVNLGTCWLIIRKVTFWNSTIRSSLLLSGRRLDKFLGNLVMRGRKSRLGRGGITSKTLVCCSLIGLRRNSILSTNHILSLGLSGVWSKRTFPVGNSRANVRTENKIKNKFYGNIRIFLRFVVNYFDSSKRDTMWIQNMSPSFLNQLYEGSGRNILSNVEF